MKKFFLGISILFFAMVSCNPIDEGQLPPSTVQGNTLNQLLSNIQGQWYVKKVQYVQGPVCAGGPNEIFWEYVADNAYSTYLFDFTMQTSPALSSVFFDNLNATDLDSTMLGFYQFHGNGGNFTNSYWIFDDSSILTQGIDNLEDGVVDGDKYIDLSWTIVGYSGLGVQAGTYKIITLNSESLVIRNLITNAIVYFERSQTNAPLTMAIPLVGEYKLLEERIYQGGVLSATDQLFQDFRIIFTNNQASYNQQKWFVGSLVGEHYPLDIASGNSAVDGPVYFNTTSTHLVSSNFYPLHDFKIIVSNSTQLILREEITCNDYTDYVFDKIN